MAYMLLIERDTPNGQLQLRVVDDATGETVAEQPNIKIALADTKGSDGDYHPVQFREYCLKVQQEDESWVEQSVILLGSEPFTAGS